MLNGLSDMHLSSKAALVLVVLVVVAVLAAAAWASRRFGADRSGTKKSAERVLATERQAVTAQAMTDPDGESKILTIDYVLYLVGGSGIIVGSIIIAKTGFAFLLSSAVPLIASGLAFIALGYATALLKRIRSHSRQSRSDAGEAESGDAPRSEWPAGLERKVPKLPSLPEASTRQKNFSAIREVQKGFYKDHEVIVHRSGEVDAKIRSSWKRFSSLDELDKYLSTKRYKYNL